MARNITVIPAKSRNELQGKSRAEKKLKVAAYCRVSTDQEDQLHSFEAQVDYYTRYISDHPNYEMAGIYADEGITMKRILPRAKGSASPLMKRTSHITIVVEER